MISNFRVPYFLTGALNTLGRVRALLSGDIDAALQYADESNRISQEAGIEASYAYELKGFIAAQRGNYSEARVLFEQALHAFEEIGAQLNVILNTTNLAHLERQFGNHQPALDYYRETIVAFRDIGQTGAVAHQLECFGFIALAQTQLMRALRLFAAASALREQSGIAMAPDEHGYFEEQLRLVREKLGTAEYTHAWAAGQVMTMDQAITHALEAEPIEQG
jgi:tetratricopeptide (TPR) repeat protein